MIVRANKRAGDNVDRGRKIDVVLRQTTSVVRRERDRDCAIPNVDVGVMVGGFGEKSDANDKRDRIGKRTTSKRP